MCGIVGYLSKSDSQVALGDVILSMLRSLGCRGPDSAGVALWSRPDEAGAAAPRWKAWIKLVDDRALARGANASEVGGRVLDVAAALGSEVHSQVQGAYLRLEMACDEPVDELVSAIERVAPDVEVVSLGRRLEVIKQVGSPDGLDRAYGVRSFRGSHGIGHTRLSTESRVDLSHSQPFWAHHLPDVATVHNGHITNYHKLRRQYEQRGYRFYTENDSEIIGIYLHDQFQRGRTLEEALERSIADFDGSFCYLVGTNDTLAFVKDRFGLKPLMVAETEVFVAIATEEIALRQSLGDDFVAIEPHPGTMQMWAVDAVTV